MDVLKKMDPEHIKREIKLRKISLERWNEFTKE